jgi:hypothetical protein
VSCERGCRAGAGAEKDPTPAPVSTQYSPSVFRCCRAGRALMNAVGVPLVATDQCSSVRVLLARLRHSTGMAGGRVLGSSCQSCCHTAAAVLERLEEKGAAAGEVSTPHGSSVSVATAAVAQELPGRCHACCCCSCWRSKGCVAMMMVELLRRSSCFANQLVKCCEAWLYCCSSSCPGLGPGAAAGMFAAWKRAGSLPMPV